MPETRFRIRWPDGRFETCYSPSSIIKHYLDLDRSYGVDEFIAACRAGLEAASARVSEVYGGGGCAIARAQLKALEVEAKRYGTQERAVIRVEGFDP
jgi:putative flavoprotein involved in K+ transport